jgi:hypothetical protein
VSAFLWRNDLAVWEIMLTFAGVILNMVVIIQGVSSTKRNETLLSVRPSSSDAVMDYLHTLVLSTDTKRLVGNLLVKEAMREEAHTKMAEQYRLKKDLDYFSTFKKDWDGEGGLPLSESVIHNFESLLPFISAKALQHIDVYPESNGSLLIMSRSKEAET